MNLIAKEPVVGFEVTAFDRHGRITDHRVFTSKRPSDGKKRPQIVIARILPDETRIIEKVYPMDSYVANLTRLMESQFGGVNVTIKDTAGVNQTYSPTGTFLRADAIVNDTSVGIVVGTGTTAVALDDTKLATQYTTTANLSYGIMQIDTPVTIGDTTSYILKRRFTNLTLSTITIKELGLYMRDAAHRFCVLREVIGGGVGHDIPAGVTTEFSIEIPVTLSTGTSSVSFTGVFAKLLYVTSNMAIGLYAIPDITDTSRNVGTPAGCWSYAGVGDLTNGIVVGSNNTAVTHADTHIHTVIPHGSGAGNLYYQQMLFDPTALGATKATCGVKRTLNNLTGATVTMLEGAWYVVAGSGSWKFCAARVVFDAGVDILGGGYGQCKFNAGIEQV